MNSHMLGAGKKGFVCLTSVPYRDLFSYDGYDVKK